MTSSLQRWAASGLACWLLLSPAAPAEAQARRGHASHANHARTCEAPKKGKSSSARGRKTDKSKSSTQESSSDSSSSSSSSQSDDSDDLGGLDDVAPAPKRAEQPAVKPEPIAPVRAAREEAAAADGADDSSASDDSSAAQADDGAEAAPAPESAATEADSGPSVLIDAYAGFGIATRSVHMPAPMTMGVLDIAPGVVPAAEVGLRVTSHPNAPFSFYVHLIYQSALGFSVTEHPPIALPKEVGARSERVALEIAPRWHLASSKLDIAIPLGATVRSLWAEVHTSETPSFSLVGPHVRVEASFNVNDVLSLRLSPELHYIMMIDQDLKTAGVGSTGPALGGDASVNARLSQTWSFGINYRESHAFLAAARGSVTFRDVERYLTLRAVGSF